MYAQTALLYNDIKSNKNKKTVKLHVTHNIWNIDSTNQDEIWIDLYENSFSFHFFFWKPIQKTEYKLEDNTD